MMIKGKIKEDELISILGMKLKVKVKKDKKMAMSLVEDHMVLLIPQCKALIMGFITKSKKFSINGLFTYTIIRKQI